RSGAARAPRNRLNVNSLTGVVNAVVNPVLVHARHRGANVREFALTLTIAVITSAVVSLTLTPMMCSRLLRHDHRGEGNRITRTFNRALDGVVEGYRRSLEWVLRRQMMTILVTAGTLALTIWLYIIIPKGFLPPQDTGLI